jgi:hypothetical protein
VRVNLHYHDPHILNFPKFDTSFEKKIAYEILHTVPDPVKFVRGWFFDAELKDIRRGNIEELMSALLFTNTPVNMSMEERESMDRIINIMEDSVGVTIESGYNENVKCMKLLLDPLKFAYKPFFVYVGIWVLHHICDLVLYANGFERHSNSHIRFWHRRRQRRRDSIGKRPIVFFHGLGIGLFPYLNIIRKLCDASRDIFLVEKGSVAMRLDHRHLLPHEMADGVDEMLKEYSVHDAVFIGHSLGTSIATWIVKYYPHYVYKLILMDPICFALWNHHIAYNFLYKKPTKWIEHLFGVFVAGETGVSFWLRRYFFWYYNCFFTNEIPPNCSVYLSSEDSVVPFDVVYNYIKKHAPPAVKTNTLQGFQHGEILTRPKAQEVICRELYEAD